METIVDTIGTIDDLIENYQSQCSILLSIILKKYKLFNFNGSKENLGDVYKISIGRTPPTKERKWFSSNRNDIKWLSIKDLGETEDYVFITSQYLTTEAVNEFNIPVCRIGDIVLSFKLTLGRVGIIENEMVTNEAIACFKTTNLNRYFLFCFLKNYDFKSEIESTSSIGKAFNSTILKQLVFLNPTKESLEEFNLEIKPLFDVALNIRKKILLLKNLRKNLLMKYF